MNSPISKFSTHAIIKVCPYFSCSYETLWAKKKCLWEIERYFFLKNDDIGIRIVAFRFLSKIMLNI